MQDYKKYLDSPPRSSEELDAALEECGVPKRVEYNARFLNLIKKYPCIKALGDSGGCGFVFISGKFNEVFGEDIFSPLDRVSSFAINVALDILLKQEENNVENI